ncbi:MAG: hypothetical protein ACK4IX_17655 [Candidatus Sericytochromatia bacterium]
MSLENKKALDIRYWEKSRYLVTKENKESIISKIEDGKILCNSCSYGTTYDGYNIDLTYYLKENDQFKKVHVYSESEYWPVKITESFHSYQEIETIIDEFFEFFSIDLSWQDKIPESF